MPPKPTKKILFEITSPEQFMEIISPENKKLAVIDVHLKWCGNCAVMEQNFRSLFFAFDNADNRLAFWTASEEVIPPEYLKGLKHGELTCKPRFLVYLVRHPITNRVGIRKERRNCGCRLLQNRSQLPKMDPRSGRLITPVSYEFHESPKLLII